MRVLGAPLQLTTIAMAAARYGSGDSRSPMVAVLTANAANVVLVALFSLGLHAGLAGVATATVLSQSVEVFVLARRQRRDGGFGLRAWTVADLRVLLRMRAARLRTLLRRRLVQLDDRTHGTHG
jgi:Na+-driven multidrug efflux pump